jgi:CRP-like cAMP-binding protein
MGATRVYGGNHAARARHQDSIITTPCADHSIESIKEISIPPTKDAPPLNSLLAALPLRDRKQLLARSTQVELSYSQILYESGERIRHVHFPNRGLISLLTPMDGRPSVEVGMVGREGMAGIPLFLGVNVSPVRALVQGSGSATCVTATAFQDEAERSPSLRRQLNRYLYTFIVQMAQTAACNSGHQVGPRLARWLLMTHDRSLSDEFYLTQGFLAQMLGVQRAGVTRAAGLLQQRKLIRYRRGQITVLNRRGLERAACQCYSNVNKMSAIARP